jgi:SAM-dependent methyltransferase
MALTQTIIGLLLRLRKAGLFDLGTGRVLDLGEQNLYGDVPAEELPAIARALKLPDTEVAALAAEVAGKVAAGAPHLAFDLAKLLYRIVFDCETYRAIDLNGTEAAWRFDLNGPIPLAETFDVVTNFGTSEHVFDQAQLFRSIHALTRPGGLMLHAVPTQGGPDHGFYNYHPTFFHDLAGANGYRLPMLVVMSGGEGGDRLDPVKDRDAFTALVARGGLAPEAGLFAALQKPFDERPFRAPMQGYYGGELSAEAARAWEERRS